MVEEWRARGAPARRLPQRHLPQLIQRGLGAAEERSDQAAFGLRLLRPAPVPVAPMLGTPA